MEQHPQLLPGAYDFHHGPLGDVVIAKFPFGADYVSDFAFITTNSAVAQFTFVKIEDPKRDIFNQNDHFSQHFNQALQQIRDWQIWGERNKITLVNMLTDIFDIWPSHRVYQMVQCYLVVGRRSMIEQSQVRQDRWSQLITSLKRDNIELMTFDRLADFGRYFPNNNVWNWLVVCAYKERKLVAKINPFST